MKTDKKTIYVDVELHTKLKKIAKKKGYFLSGFVNSIIIDYLETKTKNK